jgi:diadenylate cyclase
LTEENDAIAVIVSEETGQVSLALEGRIERDLSADELRARLEALVFTRRESSSQKSSWRVNEL